MFIGFFVDFFYSILAHISWGLQGSSHLFLYILVILVRIPLWQVPMAGQISQDWKIGFTGENHSSIYFVLQNSLNMLKAFIFSLMPLEKVGLKNGGITLLADPGKAKGCSTNTSVTD